MGTISILTVLQSAPYLPIAIAVGFVCLTIVYIVRRMSKADAELQRLRGERNAFHQAAKGKWDMLDQKNMINSKGLTYVEAES